MKISNLAAIFAAAALSAVVLAQGGPQGRPMGQGGPGGGRQGGGMPFGRRMDPKMQADRTTQMMTQRLGLTAVQQAKVKAIVLKAALDMKKVRDAQEAALKKVLTPAQLKTLMTPRPMGGAGGPGAGRRPGM